MVVSEKVVRRIMREEGLVVRRKKGKRYSSYAGEAGERPANLPLREDGTHDFSAKAPNEKWVSDVTEFALPCGAKAYLSPVIDLFDGKPVGCRDPKRLEALKAALIQDFLDETAI